MAGQKISQLSGLETLTGAEKIPVELNGGNYSIPTSLLKPFVFTWKPNRDQSFDQLIKCLTTGIPVIYKVSDQEVYPVIGYAKIGAQDTIALWSRNSADALNVVVAKDAATGGVSVVSMDYVDIVKYVNASDNEHPNRKAIQLRNNDPLTGIANKEGLGSVNIAMVNDKDIVDLGTSELPINLNTPAGVRPTVQEAGQTGETANKIAYLSDLDNAGGDVEVVKITRFFNESPSVLEYQTYILPEENTKLWNALESGKTIVLALYDGNNPADAYVTLTATYGNLSIEEVAEDVINIEVAKTGYDNTYGLFVKYYKYGTFTKGNDGNQIIAYNDSPTNSMYFDKSGGGTKFLNDKGSYVVPNQLGDGTKPVAIKTTTDEDVSHVVGETSYKMWDTRNLPDPAPLTDIKPTSLITVTNDIPLWEDSISYTMQIPVDNLQISDADELKRRFQNNIPFVINMLYAANGITFQMHRDITFEANPGVTSMAFRCFVSQGRSNFDVQYWINFDNATANIISCLKRVVKMSDDNYQRLTSESPEIVNKLKNIIVYTENEGTEGQILKIVDGKPTWVDPS